MMKLQDLEGTIWQPAATSTPCPKNANFKPNHLSRKPLVQPSDIINVLLKKEELPVPEKQPVEAKTKTCNKTQNSRVLRIPFKYFDESSSSDDDDDDDDKPKKAPLIIFSENTKEPKSVLKNKIKTESNNVQSESEIKTGNQDKVMNSHCEVNSVNKKKNTVIKAFNSTVQSKIIKNRKIKEVNTFQTKIKSVEDVKKSILKDLNGIRGNLSNFEANKIEFNNIQKPASPVKNNQENNHVEVKNNTILSPVSNSSKKRNSSHQLFSDSLEQELINSLDLTQPDPEPEVKAEECNNYKKKIPYTASKKTSLPQTKKSVRAKKPPKEFWIPESNVQHPGLTGSKLTSSSESKENKAHGEVFSEFCGKTIKSVSENKRKRRKDEGIKVGLVPEDKRKRWNQEKEAQPNKVVANIPDSTTSDFFKQLNQLPCLTESQPGCLTSQCWALKTFKCGVFRLKPQAVISCRTSHFDSYFGGVLVLGRLRMKIGEEELELKQGDMTFVPPLTDWAAYNPQDSESVFYYWSGRFKSGIRGTNAS